MSYDEQRAPEHDQNDTATTTPVTPEVDQLRKKVELDTKIAELRKDEANKIMLDLGLEAEIREDPGILEGSAWKIKTREYASKALNAKNSTPEPANQEPAKDPKPETVKDVAQSFVASAPTPVQPGEETYIPSQKSMDELMAMGYTKEQAALAKAFPH